LPETQVIDCPECGAKVCLSVRNSGEIVILDSEEPDPLEELREL